MLRSTQPPASVDSHSATFCPEQGGAIYSEFRHEPLLTSIAYPRPPLPSADFTSLLVQLEAPHLTATLPLVPPLNSLVTGLVFADEDLASLAHPETDKKKAKAALPLLDVETGGRCLPAPPANGIVVCATSARYPPVKNLKKNKKWRPFEEVAGRLAKAALVRLRRRSVFVW